MGVYVEIFIFKFTRRKEGAIRETRSRERSRWSRKMDPREGREEKKDAVFVDEFHLHLNFA